MNHLIITRRSFAARLRQTAIGLGSLCLLTGCGPDLPPMGEVYGVVTNKEGQPVEGVSIEFVPVDGGRPSMALTDKEGKYQVRYLPEVTGALLGKHAIRYQNFGAQPDLNADPDAMFVPTQAPDKLKGTKMMPEEVVVDEGSNEVNFEFVESK